jgi:predicted GNAT superfamily acetyltransferase
MRLQDLTTIEDYRRVVELEKIVWGYTDSEDVVPVPILVITVKRGGILIGAFTDDDIMVGFVYSLPGLKDRRPTQWSHMLGVLDEYRNTGVGHQLKLEQRLRTLAMGIDLVEWTYDPLQALNAHLNFTKLGVIVEEYEENIYGDSSSPLHRGTPTDRFVCEWHITTPHVARRIDPVMPSGSIGHESIAGLPIVNRTQLVREWRRCGDVNLALTAPRLLVEIPTGFTAMQAGDPDLARSWRFATREIFTAYFGREYRAVDFILDRDNRRGHYLLVKRGDELA